MNFRHKNHFQLLQLNFRGQQCVQTLLSVAELSDTIASHYWSKAKTTTVFVKTWQRDQLTGDVYIFFLSLTKTVGPFFVSGYFFKIFVPIVGSSCWSFCVFVVAYFWSLFDLTFSKQFAPALKKSAGNMDKRKSI